MFSKTKIETSMKDICAKIQEADAIVIGAGAGLSTAAGYEYAGERFNRYFSDFEEKYGINLQIKAPNDIYYNGKKVGGILTESKIVGQKTKYIVVGIGINTNGKNFSDDIKNIATSIKKEFNIDVDNLFIVNEFCKIFEKRLMKRIEE